MPEAQLGQPVTLGLAGTAPVTGYVTPELSNRVLVDAHGTGNVFIDDTTGNPMVVGTPDQHEKIDLYVNLAQNLQPRMVH